MRRMSYVFTAMMFLWSGTFASANWPNEQTGSTTLCNWPFDSVAGKGTFAPGGGGGRIVTDANAQSPSPNSNVWRNTRNATSRDAGLVEYRLPSIYQEEVFYGFWFKASDPSWGWFDHWYQKISLLNDEVPHIYMKMVNLDQTTRSFSIVGHPEHVRSVRDWENGHIAPDGVFWPNVNNQTYRMGQWYRIEVYCKRSTTSTSRNGIYKWWVNGVLAGNYIGVNFEAPIRKVLLTNIWDSEYSALPYEEWVEYDHMYVSLPPGVMQPLTISTGTLPTGNTTTMYPSTVLAAKGGMPPYTWSLESGTLPAGMNFYPTTGFISGTPAEGGTKSLVFKVTDALKATAMKMVSLVISGGSAISADRAPSRSNGISLSTHAASSCVSFDLQFQNEGKFSIGVFDLHGRNVWNYSASTIKGTSAQAIWNYGNKLSKGVYLVRLEQGGKTTSTNYCHVW